ncbi:hypothetical protein [Pollutibacter soli]|uniref:hypothetical protein n=1 Tax=Pollutibacter soli TaxID=3034157 RepID=UPI003013B717
MAEEKIGLDLEVNVGNFKKDLREANNELTALVDKFGATDERAIAAAKKVAGFRDALGDAKALADAFNPDRKFQALQGAINGVLGGFTAFQGALGLIGVESEEVEKTLLKVQSALALSQGVNNILELKDTFNVLSASVKNSTIVIKANELANKATAVSMKALGISAETTSVSFKVLKTAIISTGIGVLLIALGEAISALQSFINKSNEAAEAQKELNKSIVESSQAGLKAGLEFLAQQEKIAIAKAKLAGKSEEEIFKLEQEYSKYRIKSRENYLESVRGLGKDEVEAQDELRREKDAMELAELNFLVAQTTKQREERKKALDQRISLEKKAIEDRKKLVEEAKALSEQLTIENGDFGKSDRDKELDAASREVDRQVKILQAGSQSVLPALEAYRNALMQINKKYDDLELKALQDKFQKEKDARIQAEQDEKDRKELQQQSLREAVAAYAENEKISANERKQWLYDLDQAILADATLTEQQKTENLDANAKARQAIEEQQARNRQKALNAAADLAAQAAQVAGEQTAAGKALAIAATTINTYQSATAAFASLAGITVVGPILGAIAAAAAVAAGIANVKKILSVKVPGAAGGGSMPSISSSATAPLTPQGQLINPRVELGQDTINATNNRTVKAYVVEKEISDAQRRDSQISRQATLGG